jgi:hypothetical protein
MPLPSRRAVLLMSLPVTVMAVGAPFATFRWLVPRDPLNADMIQLSRWLVLYDVAELPLASQRELVERLQLSLPELRAAASDGGQLSAKQETRLLANADRLQRVWLELRSEQNSQKPANAERITFMREQVDTLLQLAELARGLPPSSDTPENPLTKLLASISLWQDEATPTLRQSMSAAVRDGLLVYMGYFDLSEMRMEEREVLAVKVAQTLDIPDTSPLPAVQVEGDASIQLQASAELIMEAWFRVQARLFDKTATSEKAAFVQNLVDRVKAWNLAQLLGEPDAGGTYSQTKLMLRLQNQLNVWSSRADRKSQPQMQSLAAAVRQNFLWASMRSFLPNLGN